MRAPARHLEGSQTKATGSEGMIRWQGGVSIATVIDLAPELGADGGDQHGGQLIFQRCS